MLTLLGLTIPVTDKNTMFKTRELLNSFRTHEIINKNILILATKIPFHFDFALLENSIYKRIRKLLTRQVFSVWLQILNQDCFFTRTLFTLCLCILKLQKLIIANPAQHAQTFDESVLNSYEREYIKWPWEIVIFQNLVNLWFWHFWGLNEY